MSWGSSFWRRMRVFVVAFAVFVDYRAVRRKVSGESDEKSNAMWESAHRRNADRILAVITELQGLWIKFGQYLSTRADVLPETYISSFRLLQDSLPPRPMSEVRDTLEKELGKPLSEIFMEFDEKPLATASIAQVHRACMKDGRDVVVKIQHRGIKECLLQDLENARRVVQWVAWAEPEYDFGPVIDEWCKEVPNELDFNLEAANTRKVASNLKSETFIKPVDVLVPEVVQSSEQVLVLAFMEGVRLSDVDALNRLGVNKQELVETITRAYAHQIYIDGFFNADPHPGNFLVSTHPPFRPILLDFGLTKSISSTLKKALAKLLLAAAEGDYAALLSSFAEMGLKLKLDMPEEAMEITSVFFRASRPAKESVAGLKDRMQESEERLQRMRSKMGGKKFQRNPVAAFPSDAVFFTRVLNLLRGISSMLNAEVAYIDIMRPYAEATLWSGSPIADNDLPIYDSPVHSLAEQQLRKLLQTMAREHRILGIQVCAYKDGKVFIDTSAGVFGKYDPRPVQPDTLFSVFSATKGVTAGLVHWLAENGSLMLSDKVSKIWPEFGANNKEGCTVAHVLNHTAGLQNAFLNVPSEDPLLMCKWDEMLKSTAAAVPETAPGEQQLYHALSFGWLCGGIVEKSSGRKFQELLEEAFVQPLQVHGEFYIGIPPGVEDRLASLTLDTEAFDTLANRLLTTDDAANMRIPASLSNMMINGSFKQAVSGLANLCNMLYIRRAILPAANGHFSARALARFYAMLANDGRVPSGNSNSSPQLGSHPHRPELGAPKKQKASKSCCHTKSLSMDGTSFQPGTGNVFRSPEKYDAFLGTGAYKELAVDGNAFGLGFRKFETSSSSRITPFGHSGVGGSMGYCDPDNAFSIAITVNKMSTGSVAADIVKLVCSEIGVPCPLRFLDLEEIITN